MSNIESQENELLSLQSIFDENEFVVEETDPPSGRMVAEVRLPDRFYVTAVEGKHLDAGICKDVFQVDHLPPINLFFKFPVGYPQETCPTFFISCNWLSLQQQFLLCKRLEHLWEMNMDVILYIWMQFLREEALDFLNIGQCLDISKLLTCKTKNNFQYRQNNDSNDSAGGTDILSSALLAQATNVVSCVNNAIDLRSLCASNELFDGDLLIRILKEYNEYKIDSIFKNTLQYCNICLTRKPGLEFVKFKNCEHIFCNDCVKEYFEGLIKEGNLNSLKCLQGDCDTRLDEGPLKGLVSSDLYERYQRLLLQSTLESMSDVVNCPRKFCQCPLIINNIDRMGTCPNCELVFCPFCKMTYHGVNPCNFKSDKRKRMFEEYMNGSRSVQEKMEKKYGKRVIRSLVDDTLSENWKSLNSKSCPSCKASIQKTDGCNKMTCYKCGSYFCWLCEKRLESTNPYLHFSLSTSECFMRLFPEGFGDQDDIQPGEFL